MFGASCVPPDNYQAFHWLYALSWSTNAGIAYFAAMHHGWFFFPDKPGFASGVILAGFGGGALIFDNLSTAIINPDNIPINDKNNFNAMVMARF